MLVNLIATLAFVQRHAGNRLSFSSLQIRCLFSWLSSFGNAVVLTTSRLVRLSGQSVVDLSNTLLCPIWNVCSHNDGFGKEAHPPSELSCTMAVHKNFSLASPTPCKSKCIPPVPLAVREMFFDNHSLSRARQERDLGWRTVHV